MKPRSGKFSIVPLTANAFNQILFANPHRRAVFFGILAANPYFLSFGQKGAANTGIEVGQSSSPFQLTYEDFGDAITWDVYLYNAGASSMFAVLESFER